MPNHNTWLGRQTHPTRANTGAGSPVGQQVPNIVGELYQDTNTDVLWIATGATKASWVRASQAPSQPVVLNSESVVATANMAGEEDMHTYTMPANTMGTDGDMLYFESQGTTAGGPTNVRLYIGASLLMPGSAVAANGDWFFRAWVVRQGATSAEYVAQHGSTAASVSMNVHELHKGSITENWGTALVLKNAGFSVQVNSFQFKVTLYPNA
jgi:hypothetical protein